MSQSGGGAAMTTGNAANPWLDRGVFHWAHQGGAREAPSNTRYAMDKGLANGAQGLEFDVHRSRDGRVVVIHDKTLERTTNGAGSVSRHSADELAKFDAAYWWVPSQVDNHDPATPEAAYELRGQVEKDPDLGIPILDNLLDRFGSMPMTIEVKEADAAEPLVALLQAKAIPFDDLIVTSFSDKVVAELHRLAPDLPLAPGGRFTFGFYLRSRLHLPVPARGPYVALQVPDRLRIRNIKWLPALLRRLLPENFGLKVTSRRLVRIAHKAGLAVHVWTIDDADQMRTLRDMEVDGIMTDCPIILAEVLAEP
jgi:glycerophosphoryl diester phosphodiesterase